MYYISRSCAGGDESSNNGIYRRCTALDLNDKGHSSSLRASYAGSSFRRTVRNILRAVTSRYEPLRDDGPGDIKRASINVKAQFPSDGYELDGRCMQSRVAFTPCVRPRLLRRWNDVKEWHEKSVIDASIRSRS